MSIERRWIGNAITFLVSLVVCLGVAEAALRYIIKPRVVMNAQLLNRMGVTDADQNWEHDPVLGWRVRPNKTFHHANPFGEFDQEVRVDALGLRIPLNDQPPVNSDRSILFIGDSVTAAFEVPYKESFVAKVSQALPARTVNAAVRGYSTEQSLKMMRILLARGMKPTDIVYQYSLNDPFENMNLHYPKRYMSKPASYLDSEGELKFKSLSYEVGIYDSDALFLTSGGEIGVLPVVGNKATPHRIVADQIKKMSQPSIWNDSYLVGLTKAAIGVLMTPKITVEQVEKKFPYIKADYIPDDFGGFSPGFIDVSWEKGSYPIKLLRKIILVMKFEAEASGARFWISLPLGTPDPTRDFLAEITRTDGLRVIDPLKMGVTNKWVAKCGGYPVFKTDGHYTACGHSGQAEAITTALSETK